MKLFNLNNFKVEIEPEALLLAPFSAIWERDKSSTKKYALNELSYVWFMQDVKSDFFAIVNEEERSREVLKVLELPDKWKPDRLVTAAEDFYRKASESLAHKLLRDSRAGLEKISETLRNPNFDTVDIKKVAEIIRMLPQLVEALNKMEESVLKEKEVIEHRGSQERAPFEDGIH